MIFSVVFLCAEERRSIFILLIVDLSIVCANDVHIIEYCFFMAYNKCLIIACISIFITPHSQREVNSVILCVGAMDKR